MAMSRANMKKQTQSGANPDNEMPPKKGDFEREETPKELFDRVKSGKIKKACGGSMKYAPGGSVKARGEGCCARSKKCKMY